MGIERGFLRWRRLALAAALLGCAPALAGGDRVPPAEYAVKAAFLFNFAKYVTWPAEAFAGPEAPLTIGVLGDDPFGGDLSRLAAEVRVQGRRLSIIRGATIAQLDRCHVLFIGPTEPDRLAALLVELRRARSTALTVGEGEQFIRAGGMIRFVVEQNKVRFEIEPAAATQAGLTISSKLLSLALNLRPRA